MAIEFEGNERPIYKQRDDRWTQKFDPHCPIDTLPTMVGIHAERKVKKKDGIEMQCFSNESGNVSQIFEFTYHFSYKYGYLVLKLTLTRSVVFHALTILAEGR